MIIRATAHKTPEGLVDLIKKEFNTESEMEAAQVIEGLSSFIQDKNIVDDHEKELIKYARTKQYVKYYGLIADIAKRCISDVKKQKHDITKCDNNN